MTLIKLNLQSACELNQLFAAACSDFHTIPPIQEIAHLRHRSLVIAPHNLPDVGEYHGDEHVQTLTDQHENIRSHPWPRSKLKP